MEKDTREVLMKFVRILKEINVIVNLCNRNIGKLEESVNKRIMIKKSPLIIYGSRSINLIRMIGFTGNPNLY